MLFLVIVRVFHCWLQVDILLVQQAQHAKNYIGENIKMLADYQNSFMGQYIRTCNALIEDANKMKTLLASHAPVAVDGNLMLASEPWMMVLSSAVPAPGTLVVSEGIQVRPSTGKAN